MRGESEGSVLVLGATSLVGRYLTPLLTIDGEAPVALSRRPAGAGAVRWVAGDLTDPQSLAAIGPVEAVFSLSPIWLLPAALPALRALGMRRLVAFSSTSRFTKAMSTSAYEKGVAGRLAEGEAQAMAFCAAHGIDWTILRPTLIYSEGRDGNVSRLAGLIRRFGVLPLAGRGQGLRQPVHAEDLAIGAAAAMVSPAARGQAYDLPGGETLTYRAMTERVFEGMGRAPRILAIPAPLWSLAFALAKPLLPGATAQMGARMTKDLTFDADPARRDFGWAPRDFRPDFLGDQS